MIRNYITSQAELESYIGAVNDFNQATLDYAMADIDSAIASFYEGGNHKAFRASEVYTDCTLTATMATIANNNSLDGFYTDTILEILDGANKGLRKFISASVNNGGTQELTFLESEAGLNETTAVRIIQIAKLPRYKDVILSDKYYKILPEFIKLATAYQYKFRITNLEYFETYSNLSSKSVSGDSVSVTYANKRFGENIDFDPRNRISPQALTLLDSEGLTIQSI